MYSKKKKKKKKGKKKEKISENPTTRKIKTDYTSLYPIYILHKKTLHTQN
jgi:hypothetical protein